MKYFSLPSKVLSFLLLTLFMVPWVSAATDVPEEAWYAPYVEELEDRGVLDAEEAFHPSDEAPRWWVVLILAKAYFGDEYIGTTENFDFGFTDLEDIPEEYKEDAIDAINLFAQYGIISGDSDPETGALLMTFRPTSSINRAEIAKILTGALALDESYAALLEYYEDVPVLDEGGNSVWFHAFVNTGTEWGLFTGDTDEEGVPLGIFRPGDFIVKAEVAALAVRGTEAEFVGPLSTVSEEDPDLDGLTNEEEMLEYFTSPTLSDTDGDEASDGEEITAGSDPLDATELPGDDGVVYEFTVRATDFEFISEDELIVPAGAEVEITFINEDEGVSHTLTFEEEDLGGTSVIEGVSIETISFTAPEVEGEYEYYCELHPSMTGILMVE